MAVDVPDDFGMSYSPDEEKAVIDYIIANNAHYGLRGNELWKIMEHDKVTTRTWQSMKERFKKHMEPQIMSYTKLGFTRKDLFFIQLAFKQTENVDNSSWYDTIDTNEFDPVKMDAESRSQIATNSVSDVSDIDEDDDDYDK